MASRTLAKSSSSSLMDGDDFDYDHEDELRDDDDGDAVMSDSRESGFKRSASYDVIHEAQIMEETEKLVKEVKEICGVPSKAIATMLLRSLKWNKEKLIERWMENSEAVMQTAGISTGDLESSNKHTRKKLDCLICLEKVDMKNSYALGCKHRYCNDCWTAYIEQKISEGTACINARCMAPKCPTLVHEEAYRRFATKASFERYQKFLSRSFVDDNPKIKWCPAPGCNNCVRVERSNRKEAVHCVCNATWCFRCADAEIGDHQPASCDDMDRWLRKASDESENVNWMVANTKKCPHCRSPIEKNGGCMHMTCTLASCRFEFCWLCRGSWKEHGTATGGYYSCNKYDKSKDAKEEDDRSKHAKTELEHYMFYFHRYESHKNARKIADQQRRTCAQREEAMLKKFDVRSADTKFMHEAVEQLLKNRAILEYSYVYGYYLSLSSASKSPERNLFEYLQEELEKYTNHLSELYERDIDNIRDYHEFIKWKEDVSNYARVSANFLKNFKEGVARGLTTQD